MRYSECPPLCTVSHLGAEAIEKIDRAMIQHQNQVSIIAEICPSISRPALSRHKKHIHTWKLQEKSEAVISQPAPDIKKPTGIEDYKDILRTSTVELLSKPSRTQAEETRLLSTLSLLKQMEESTAASKGKNEISYSDMADFAVAYAAETREEPKKIFDWTHARLLRIVQDGIIKDEWIEPLDPRYDRGKYGRQCGAEDCKICAPFPIPSGIPSREKTRE